MSKRKTIDRRKRSIWPLPGGERAYATSLRQLLREAREQPAREDMVERLKSAFPGVKSGKAARSYITVLSTLGFVTLTRQKVRLTKEGASFLQNGDARTLRAALLERIYGVREILELLRSDSLRIGILHERLISTGVSWKTQSQVRYRLRWMEAAGLVERRPARACGGYLGYRATRDIGGYEDAHND